MTITENLTEFNMEDGSVVINGKFYTASEYAALSEIMHEHLKQRRISDSDHRTEPKRRSGRTLAVGLRAIIRDKKASVPDRRKACEMLGVVEGLWTLTDIRSGTAKAAPFQTEHKSSTSLQSLIDSSS